MLDGAFEKSAIAPDVDVFPLWIRARRTGAPKGKRAPAVAKICDSVYSGIRKRFEFIFGQSEGQRDDTVGMIRDLREVDRRLAALVALEEAGRAQLDQIAVAGRGGG